jgi:hypothetical protein
MPIGQTSQSGRSINLRHYLRYLRASWQNDLPRALTMRCLASLLFNIWKNVDENNFPKFPVSLPLKAPTVFKMTLVSHIPYYSWSWSQPHFTGFIQDPLLLKAVRRIWMDACYCTLGCQLAVEFSSLCIAYCCAPKTPCQWWSINS